MADNGLIDISLSAAIVAVIGNAPSILRVPGPDRQFGDALPSGTFDPRIHRTMEISLRGWVEEQTALRLGYVEQLYTFGDRGRHAGEETETHMVSVGYLALTRVRPEQLSEVRLAGAEFRNWYAFLPWEDWRQGRPAMLDETIIPALRRWAREADRRSDVSRGMIPSARVRLAFGIDGIDWDEERILDRYELMYSAGLLAESVRDGRYERQALETHTGAPMDHDHRRILATAISRLRAKLKYRPLVFELLPQEFTLTELQNVAESISGRGVHKQNFRRLVENTGLVEATGATSTRTGGRPAALFRFRREVVEERPSPGLRIGRR